ncbi:Autophagy- protein 9A [Clonorchis sinensis]|uniref:Autophagy-related protein 9 n=1 Tax=Clonorchis sinensis TaxID=79923 RepID=A0A419QIA0_CLOSI|nr:Autophagy- protein 9A [Clonorchis sinensis]
MGGTTPSRAHYQPLPDAVEETPLSIPILHPGRYKDQFFRDIYNYHQCGGFWAILLTEIVWFVKFLFIIFVGTELTVCTRWEVLANHSVYINEWSDAFTPPNKCWATLPLLPSLLVAGAVFAFLIQLVLCTQRLQRFWETRLFCTNVLGMPQSSTGLGDMTWSDVQKRLITRMPQTEKLDELAVYNRILRHENYLVVMINRKILPVHFSIPLFSPPWNYPYLPDGYLFNIKMLLFWTPWSPFSHGSRLQPEYRDPTRQQELAAHLSKMSCVLGLLNLIFAPIILIAQALVFLCSNAQRIRFHPASVFGRRWSNYAHLYLRSVNELQHEFTVRIGQAYDSAAKYLDCFVSRNLVTLADAAAFILGSASVAFFVLGLVHEQMMHLSGYWAILVVGGLVARICISYIPDEQVVQSPEVLLRVTLSKIHHSNDQWIKNAATSRVYTEFSHLFHYRIVGALEDILSPILTPFLLLFFLPNHTAEIVSFFRNYTVDLGELGHVCSLATLDVGLHRDPDFQFDDDGTETAVSESPPEIAASQPKPLSGGKLEISLIAFHQNNPDCILPDASRSYLQSFKRQLMKELPQPATLFQPAAFNSQDQTFGITPQGQLSPLPSIPPGARIKNVSHLPGPGYIDTATCGVVGALTESMKSSMHRSDPGVTFPISTTRLSPRNASKPSGSIEVSEDNANIVGGLRPSDQADQSSIGPGHSVYQARYPSDLLNTSLMLAYQAYTPYTSQMESGSSQYWELASSAINGQAGRGGLTALLTADTSASILCLQELVHRRRLQQSVSLSASQHPYHGKNHSTDSGDASFSAFRPPSPYQAPCTSGTSSASSRFKPPVGRAIVDPGAFASTPHRFGYGAIGSTETLGIVRTSVEGRRIQRPLVAEAVEEDDELSVTPRGTPRGYPLVRGTGDSTPPSRPTGISNIPTGVVTVSTSPSLRAPIMQRAAGVVDDAEHAPMDREDTDPNHILPDLPPTNC